MSELLLLDHEQQLIACRPYLLSANINSLIQSIQCITTFGIIIKGQTNFNHSKIYFQGHLYHLCQQIDTLTKASINLKNGHIKIKTRFEHCNIRLVLPSNQMRISLQHRLSMINQQKIKNKSAAYLLNSKNNMIQLVSQANLASIILNQPTNIYFIIRNLLEEHLKILIDSLCLQYLLRSMNIIHISHQNNQIIQRIIKFIHMSQNATVLKKFQEGPVSVENFTYYRVQKNYIEQLSNIFQLTKMYSFLKFSFVPSKQKLILNEKENQTLQIYLQTPVARASKNPAQNKYLFNYIQLRDCSSVRTSQFAQGGSSVLLAGRFTFHYIPTILLDTKLSEPDEKQEKVFITKILAIKTPKQPKYRYKIQNEINIITKLKGAASAFILKYYLSKQENFAYKHLLLMDAIINCNTLRDFMILNKQTLSLKTKLIVLSHIAQGLRFLSNYKITHMDLKPNNILVMLKEGLVKIIDFSEAYSPQNKQNYSPGYSFPYSAPQVYDPNYRKFNEKQDSFSFGMIAYEMIYSNLPCPRNENLIPYFQSKQYQKFAFTMIPQSWESLEKASLINLLYLYIVKCLNQKEQLRCCPSWSQAILRTFFTYQYQL